MANFIFGTSLAFGIDRLGALGHKTLIIKSMKKGYDDVRSHFGCFGRGYCNGICDMVTVDTQGEIRSHRPFSAVINIQKRFGYQYR